MYKSSQWDQRLAALRTSSRIIADLYAELFWCPRIFLTDRTPISLGRCRCMLIEPVRNLSAEIRDQGRSLTVFSDHRWPEQQSFLLYSRFIDCWPARQGFLFPVDRMQMRVSYVFESNHLRVFTYRKWNVIPQRFLSKNSHFFQFTN